MPKDFDLFMSQLKETNLTLDSICDFEKISKNVDDVKLSLCVLNSLIGSADLRRSVETIWNRDKRAFSVMDILVAVRKHDRKKVLDAIGNCLPLEEMFSSVDGVMDFLQGTGLADILQNRKIGNLVDYVFGIETGLDSNARKNRGGDAMANTVANIFAQAGIKYRTEVRSNEWQAITDALGSDKKRFDFVIETPLKTYLIEVNFYSGGGSKLNEVARSYYGIAPKINAVDGFEFVWITDGGGWRSARNKLQEAYSIIPSVYNLTTIWDFVKSL
jgi:type II restriction enzyme